MSDQRFEYRVVWKREGLKPARTLRQTLKGAERRVAQLEWAETSEAKKEESDYGGYPSPSPYADIPKLESVQIQRRVVGDWETA